MQRYHVRFPGCRMNYMVMLMYAYISINNTEQDEASILSVCQEEVCMCGRFFQSMTQEEYLSLLADDADRNIAYDPEPIGR